MTAGQATPTAVGAPTARPHAGGGVLAVGTSLVLTTEFVVAGLLITVSAVG